MGRSCPPVCMTFGSDDLDGNGSGTTSWRFRQSFAYRRLPVKKKIRCSLNCSCLPVGCPPPLCPPPKHISRGLSTWSMSVRGSYRRAGLPLPRVMSSVGLLARGHGQRPRTAVASTRSTTTSPRVLKMASPGVTETDGGDGHRSWRPPFAFRGFSVPVPADGEPPPAGAVTASKACRCGWKGYVFGTRTVATRGQPLHPRGG